MAKLMNNMKFDNALKAMEYYERVFGAKILGRNPMTKEMAEQMNFEGNLDETTIHGYFTILDNMIMCADNFDGETVFSDQHNMMIDFNTDDAEEMKNLDAIYNSTSSDEQTEVILPLAEQFWGGKMAIIKDAYGITWMFHAQSYSQFGIEY